MDDVLHANPCEIRRFICQQRPSYTERKTGLINSPLTFACANRLVESKLIFHRADIALCRQIAVCRSPDSGFSIANVQQTLRIWI